MHKLLKANRPSLFVVAPNFRLSDTEVFQTDAEKAELQQYRQELNRSKYAYVAQIAEALTTMTPQILGYLFRKACEAGKLLPTNKSAVISSYWNLRIFFHRAGIKITKAVVGRKLLAIETLREELQTAASTRFFTLRELTIMRYRMQPQRIIRALLNMRRRS